MLEVVKGEISRGLVHVYTGNGKGKTTAALGLALRAAGHGLKVHSVLFMKAGWEYGEFQSMKGIPNTTYSVFGPSHLVNPKAVGDSERQVVWEAFQHAKEVVNSGQYDLVILDEINVALAWGLLPLEPAVELVKSKPEQVELVLTGRYAPEAIVELGDYVTEMVAVRHPYDRRLAARRGIEY